jgi:hypothetical protein
VLFATEDVVIGDASGWSAARDVPHPGSAARPSARSAAATPRTLDELEEQAARLRAEPSRAWRWRPVAGDARVGCACDDIEATIAAGG